MPLNTDEPSPFVGGLDVPEGTSPVGYAWLHLTLRLSVLPHHRWSFVGASRRELQGGGVLRVVYPARTADPARMGVLDHALFALKHDGLSMEILAALFERLEGDASFATELADAVRTRPTSKYVRRLWYVYELLTAERIDVPDASTGNYVPLLDPAAYVTGPPRRSRRQRVDDNLLGDTRFSPMVRRTETRRARRSEALGARIEALIGRYDADVLRRATSYLYTKETMSSFEIEHERPPKDRAERFMALLEEVDRKAPMTKARLLALQNTIVGDRRFAATDWRDGQVYVGEALDWARQRVHFVAPRAEDVGPMMEALLDAMARLEGSDADPVAVAAAMSFGFVFIHPFDDGNGRLHRFLVHHVLARMGLTPPGVIVPVSAVMLAREREYDACLERFSRPLMQRIDYEVDAGGRLEVQGETARYYRYFDATAMTEHLYSWLEEAIERDLREELEFVSRFRAAKHAVSRIIDMPDRLVSLFIKLAMQETGRLSERKRARHFPTLTDDEVAAMEQAVREAMLDPEG